MIQAGLRACLCASLFAFAGAASAASSLTLVSAAGEPLGGGLGTRTFTTPVVTSNNSDTRSVDLEFAMPGETWRFEFMSPVNDVIHPGKYLNAERLPNVTGLAPGMRITTTRGDCGAPIWGSFTIRQVEFDPASALKKLEATFTYRCDSATAPLLSGTIKFEAPLHYFTYSRDDGFPIGVAKARTYYGDTSLVDVQGYPSGLLYSHISGQRDEWYIQFTMPTGKPLAKGIYALAPVADDTHASASVDYNQPGECFGMTGSLNVRNITWDGPTMTGLYATYTLYCEGSTAAYRGTIHAGL